MKTYGQFCPVAKASEIFGERWMLLIVRELAYGAEHFNDIRRGIPLISPTLLSQRLKQLEQVGIVTRSPDGSGQRSSYQLTEQGQELRPLVELAGTWGSRWVRSELKNDDLDAGVLMWDVCRRLQPEYLPDHSVVLHFHFPDADKGMKKWWILVDSGEVELCQTSPGSEPDLLIESDLRTMTAVWVGDESFRAARKQGAIHLSGSRALTSRIWAWLGLSVFANVKPA